MGLGRFLSLEIVLVGGDTLIALARIQVVVIVLDVLVPVVAAVLDVDILVLEEGIVAEAGRFLGRSRRSI